MIFHDRGNPDLRTAPPKLSIKVNKSQPGTICSNRARAQGGPALRPLTKANLHFLSKLLVYNAGTGPSAY